MSAPLEEQETIITWTRGDEHAEIYTTDTTVMTRLNRLCKNHPETWSQIKHEWRNKTELISTTYKCPRKMVSFRSTSSVREQTGNPEALRRYMEQKKAERQAEE